MRLRKITYALFIIATVCLFTSCKKECKHVSSDWIVDATETCTKKGSKHKECAKCHEILATEEIPVLGHKYNKNGICTRCGDVLKQAELEFEMGPEYTYYIVTGIDHDENDKSNLAIIIPKEYKGYPVVAIKNEAFKKPISFNVIPQIDNFCENGYTKEEMKVVNETKKILHLAPDLPISCTAARVPVFNSHSEAVDIEFEQKVTPEQIREILNNSFGVKVIDNIDNFEYPTTKDSSGVDPVFVGRIRKNLAFDNGISLWCVADNLRIGAALNTVRICKKVIEMGLY